MSQSPLTTPFSAFEGRVIFYCRHISRQTVITARTLRESIETLPDNPAAAYELDVDDIVTLVTCTQDIAFFFNGDEGVMLKELQGFWREYRDTPHTSQQAAALVVKWAIHTSDIVRDEWVRAVNTALQPIRKPEQLPGDALTEAEKQELKNPDSPLASEDVHSAPNRENMLNSL